MADEIILQYVKSIDERTARIESNMTTAMQIHQTQDNEKHDEFEGRIKSLENSRLTARVGITALALGGGTGVAKLGLIGKFMSMFGGSPT